MLVTPDPFPSPAHKKEGKGSGQPDYHLSLYLVRNVTENHKVRHDVMLHMRTISIKTETLSLTHIAIL